MNVLARAATAMVAVAAALLLCAALLAPAARAQQAPPTAPTGWLRVGHLAPHAPTVEIYFAPVGQAETPIGQAAYGDLGSYLALPAGRYTWSMRPAGAPQASPAALDGIVDIRAGLAYTALVLERGPQHVLQSEYLGDDLATPPPGTGRVRLLQGAEGAPLPAGILERPTDTRPLAYGATSPYSELPAGRWTAQVQNGAARSSVEVTAGSTTTLLVTDNGTGLQLRPITDSTALATMPNHGVETGAGGTAAAAPTPAVAAAAAALAVTVLALITVAATGRARRRAQ